MVEAMSRVSAALPVLLFLALVSGSALAEPSSDGEEGFVNSYPQNIWVKDTMGVLITGCAPDVLEVDPPFSCTPQPWDAQTEGVRFDMTSLTGSQHLVRVHVRWDGGTHLIAVGGFYVLAGTDRDDDARLTSDDPWDDDVDAASSGAGDYDDTYVYGYSNQPIQGGDCSAPDRKDDKDCGDGLAAVVYLCLTPDTVASTQDGAGPGDGAYDELEVHVGSWASADPKGNTGAGVTAFSAFTVNVDVVGTTCTVASQGEDAPLHHITSRNPQVP